MATGSDSRAGRSDGEMIVASMREPALFAEVFDRHYGEIAAYLARRVGEVLGEELASETFVRAFAKRGRYDSAYRDARPWLYGIATNLLRKHMRAEERRRRAYARALEREDDLDGIEGIAERVDAAAGARAVAFELSRLAAADRETLVLFALTDLGYEGVAVATGVRVGTVRSRLHRVRRRLQAVLADEADLADPATSKEALT